MSWFSKLFKKNVPPIEDPNDLVGIYQMVNCLVNQAEDFLPRLQKKSGSDSYEVRNLKNVIDKGNLILSSETPEELKGKYLASLTESIRKSGMLWHL